jgi:hypothetical protein
MIRLDAVVSLRRAESLLGRRPTSLLRAAIGRLPTSLRLLAILPRTASLLIAAIRRLPTSLRLADRLLRQDALRLTLSLDLEGILE